jgi:hypothetical protein
MLLPSPAVRASYKLKDAAQRLLWGLMLLESGLYKTPASAAIPALGIPAIAAKPGILPDFRKESVLDTGLAPLFLKGVSIPFQSISIPLNSALVATGLPLNLCTTEITKSVPTLLNSSLIPADSAAIPDGSLQTTVEGYIVEQYLLMRADAWTHKDVSFSSEYNVGYNPGFSPEYSWKADWDEFLTDEYQYVAQNCIRLNGKFARVPIAKNAAGVATGWAGYAIEESAIGIAGFSAINPYQVCTITNYLAAKEALTAT